MTNKITSIIIGLSLIAAAVGFVIYTFTPEIRLGESILRIGLAIGQLFGLMLLMRNGTILGTVYFKIILFGIGVAIIGSMVKIMHWPGTSIILSTSLIGIALTYTVWFITKKEKGHLDILKLLWVLTAYIGAALQLQHWITREILLITHALFWITLIDFIVTGLKKKTLFAR